MSGAAAAEVALPRFIQLEPVGQCNLRCEMCPIQFRRDGPPWGPPAFMDFALFQGIVEGLPELSELHLQGLGEPMMHPRFFDMVRYAAGHGVRVTTNSNMTLMTERRAGEAVTSGLAVVHASIDGATAATYEAIRRRAHFDRVIANTRRLVDARDRLGADAPRLHVVGVAMRRNLAELPALARLAAELGADELFVQHLAHDFAEEMLPGHYAPMREYVDRESLLGEDPARVAAVFAETRDVAASLGLRLRLPPLRIRHHAPGTPGPERCDWPWTKGYVAYDGSAMPCCMVATPDRATLGDAAEGFAAAWRDARYERFREALASDEPPAICRTCALYNGTF